MVYLAVLNLVTFALYGADKRRAKKGQWRIPEKTLLILPLLGGSVGGILGMAVFYLLFALLLKILGKDRVARVFPPIIVGPIIMVLGLSLASVGVQEAEANWPIAIITFLIAVGVNNFSKGLTRVMTIIIALVGGFIISIPFGLVDFTALKEAAWIGVPSFTLPQFSWRGTLM